MKYLIPIFAALAICGCAGHKDRIEVRRALPAPDVALIKVPVAVARQSGAKAAEQVSTARESVRRGAALATEIKAAAPAQAAAVDAVQTELASAELELTVAQENLASMQDSLTSALAEADKVQEDVNDLKNTAALAVAKADKLEVDLKAEKASHAKTLAAYHRLKFGVALIVAVVAGLLAARLAGSGIFMANPWIQIGVPVAVGLGVFALLFLIL